jgi:hypothetical protein
VTAGLVVAKQIDVRLSSLAEAHSEPHNSSMQPRTQRASELPLRPQDELECRRCDVHCDKVVYPSACLERACPFVYAYQEFGHTYIGCMQKVYAVEIDVDLLHAAEARGGGFGAIRSMRRPLPMCKVEVEETYGTQRAGELGCQNPEFHELPAESATFKIFARIAD